MSSKFAFLLAPLLLLSAHCGGDPDASSLEEDVGESDSELSGAKAGTLRYAVTHGPAHSHMRIGNISFPDIDRPAFTADNNEIAGDYNLLTAPAFYPWRLEPVQGQFDFEYPDRAVAFAQKNNMMVKGHTLVWYFHPKDAENWRAKLTPAALRTAVLNSVRTAVTRYKGRVKMWDVANEFIGGSSSPVEDGIHFRSTYFTDAFLGKGKYGMAHFLADVYRTAHEADPKALLIYNEFGFEDPSTGGTGKLNDTIELINAIHKRGGHVDMVGMQSHLSTNTTPTKPEFAKVMKRLETEANVNVVISELDVRRYKKTEDAAGEVTCSAAPVRTEAQQGRIYHDVIEACMDDTHCKAVSLWGDNDANSWIRSSFGCPQEAPLLLNPDMTKKVAYAYALNALKGK